MKQSLTRWQKFYHDDPSLGTIPASICAGQATNLFSKNHKKVILDLGCGAGRDTVCLAREGNLVVGCDAAYAGLALAQKRQSIASRTPHYTTSLAQYLPFPAALFEGVYCFGLLHEFVGASANTMVTRVMGEVYRVLKPSGLLVLAVLAGDPDEGLPHVQLFTEEMFDACTCMFECLEKKKYEDVGCTGKSGYPIWYGHFAKPA